MEKYLKIKILLISFLFFCAPVNGLKASEASDIEVLLSIGSFCGDGSIQSGEECDDGNNDDGDGCSSTCTIEIVDPDTGGGGDNAQTAPAPKIFNVEYQILENDVLISWETNKPARSEVRWGETEEVSDKKILETVKRKNHQTILENLEIGKDYFFKIVVEDFLKRKDETEVYQVIIPEEEDREAPKNVSNLKAFYEKGEVHLTWENPIDDDLQAVKVLRKEDIFSNYINDGLVILNDKEEEAVDANVEFDKLYFYTVYTYDNDFNFSSGVGVIVRTPEKEQPLGDEDLEQDLEDILDDKEEYVPEGTYSTSTGEMVYENDFSFRDVTFQLAKKTIVKEEDSQKDLDFLPGTILDVEINKNDLPQGLKTIIFSIDSAEEKEEKNVYLAKIDEEDNVYRAQIVTPREEGYYDLNIIVLNYKNGKYLKNKKMIRVESFGKVRLEKVDFPWSFFLENVSDEDLQQTKLTLFVKQDGTFKKWQARKFHQFNPLFVDYKNEFGFLVENGDYLLRVEQPGFFSSIYFFEVENNLVNGDYSMIAIPYLDKKFILVLTFVMSFVFIFIKRVALATKDKK